MAGYDGAGSLFAIGVRITKLDASGAPLPGNQNCYVTDSLVSIGLNQEYSEPDAIELKNGSGGTCVYYQPPKTLLKGLIEDFVVCTPDPVLLQFCCGGELITTGGTNEVQSLSITGTPTGGTYTLTFAGQTTSALAYNANAAAIQAALLALSNLDTGDVTVTGTGPYVITFGGQYANQNVAQITTTASLTGGTSPAAAVTTTTAGVPGDNVIGYRAPEVNVDATPNGVAIEAFSRAIIDNAAAATLPYLWWVMPRARLVPSEAMTLSGEDALTPTLSGDMEQNANFGTGPTEDIGFPTNRVWQYCRTSTIPDLTTGFVTVS